MKKSKLLSIILTVALATTIAGCGSKETEKPEEVKTEKANIIWAGWTGEEESAKPIIQGMIDNYNSKSEIGNVSWVGWPWADTLQQLIIRNQGSEILDIAQVDIGMFSTLASMDVLVDLNDVMGKDYLTSNFEEASLAIGQKDGKQFGMPWSVASIGMVYNPDILKRAGYNEPPKTVKEFEECLEKVKALGDDIIPYGLATKDGTATGDFMPWLWTFGGSFYDKDGNISVNNEKGLEAMNWYKSLMDKNYIRTNMSRFDARQLFAQGKIAFYDDAILAKGVAVNNGVDSEKIQDVAKPMVRPVLNAGDVPQSTMWGHMLVIFKKSANPEVAADFAKHVVSEEESLKYFKNNGMPPVLKSVLSADEIKNDYWASAWQEITKTGKNGEFVFNEKSAELTTIVSEEVQAVLVGSKSPQQAIDDMENRMKSVN